MRKQEIIVEVTPTETDIASEHARYVINVLLPQERLFLEEVVRKDVPSAKEGATEKTIIRTESYKCPCCNAGAGHLELWAIVRVRCPGQRDIDHKEVEGLYSIDISPHGSTKVVVSKLSGTIIYQGSL